MDNHKIARFSVEIKRLSEHPVVAADGALTHEVTFLVHADGAQSGFEVDGGVVSGDVLARCLDLQETGSVIVNMPSHWVQDPTNDNWHHEVVDAALDRAKSESA
jgi:hypothetical protein